MKRFLFLLIGSVLSVVVQAADVTLRVWGIPVGAEIDPYVRAGSEVIAAFEKANPGVRVVSASGLQIQGPASEANLFLAFAGGSAPDVFMVYFRQMGSYASQGLLRPLDDFIRQDPESVAEIRPTVLEALRTLGPVYCLPFEQVVSSLYYRKDLFREAGLDPDRPPRTWDEFYATAKRLTNPEKGQYGFGFDAMPGMTAWWWTSFLFQAGGDVLTRDSDGNWRAAFNTDAGEAALAFYRRLLTETWTDSSGVERRGVAIRATNLFSDYIERGRLGMWFQNQTTGVVGDGGSRMNPATVGIAPMPQGPGGAKGSVMNAVMWGISSQQKDPRVLDAAWKFLRFQASSQAEAIRTRVYVETGMAGFVSPANLRRFGYPEMISPSAAEWERASEEAFRHARPEPISENSQFLYISMDEPLNEVALYPDRPLRPMLERAAAKVDAELNGTARTISAPVRARAVGVLAFVAMTAFVLAVWLTVRALRARLAEPTHTVRASRLGRTHWSWVFLAPAVLSILVWAYLPLGRGLLMAFQDYRLVGGGGWVGIDNFVEVLTQPLFYRALANSFTYVAISLGIGFCLPIILALLLSEVPRAKMLYRTIFFLPAVTSGLVIVFLWKQFYNPSQSGLFNHLLTTMAQGWNALFGFAHRIPTPVAVDWLGDPRTALLAVALPAIWAAAGPGSIIYLAALRSVPDEYYEAADLDGAGVRHKVMHIALPSLRLIIMINFVGAFIGAFKAMDTVLIMTGGGPLHATHTMGLEVWYNAFMYLKFGYATAVGWVMGAILIGFTIYQLRVLRGVRFTSAASGEKR
jgi:multiple sugar transport system permease protein